MLNENAKKWVAALRSGKYKQGRNRLNTATSSDNKFCCLGVACEVAIENGMQLGKENSGSTSLEGDTVKYNGYGRYLPHEVTEWLGLCTNSGSYFESREEITPTHSGALAQLNDMGQSFDEIADVIESEPKGLFCNPK